MKFVKSLLAVAGLLLVSTYAFACPVNCTCDAYGNVVKINSDNTVTNKNTYNTNQVNSNNKDNSIHNTAQGGKGGSAKQHQVQSQTQTQDQTAEANNSGNNGTGNVTDISYKAARIPVSTAYAASLTSGIDTCLGSISGGAQTMPVGISIGGTKKDENCIFIKKVHLLKEFSEHVACLYMRKHDRDIDEAYAEAGVDCPPEEVVELGDTTNFVTHEELTERDRQLIRHGVGVNK